MKDKVGITKGNTMKAFNPQTGLYFVHGMGFTADFEHGTVLDSATGLVVKYTYACKMVFVDATTESYINF